jgi:hypothetical protein
MLNTRLQLGPRLRMGGAILLPVYTFMTQIGTTIPFLVLTLSNAPCIENDKERNFYFFNQQTHFLFSYFCSIHPTHVSAVTLPSSRYIHKFTSLFTGPFGIITEPLHCLRLFFTLAITGCDNTKWTSEQ